MKQPIGLAVLALAIALASGGVAAQKPAAQKPAQKPVAAQKPAVQVFKEATCGCCSNWVEHLRRAGFAPTASNVDDLPAVKQVYKVPPQVRSCHTALVGGYVIEGHVPVADIQRLLKEKPAVVGLAVPGMPIGSPGMEGPNPRPYDVLAFDKAGKTTVFSTQRP